jgi:hypothetical protein
MLPFQNGTSGVAEDTEQVCASTLAPLKSSHMLIEGDKLLDSFNGLADSQALPEYVCTHNASVLGG